MDEDEVWGAIDAQRRRTVELLTDLRPEEWDQPSLCAGWRVRDVAAHLTLQQLTVGDVLRMLLAPRMLRRQPLGMNGLIRYSAVDAAEQPTEVLVKTLRSMIGSRRYNVGLTPWHPLLDVVVHGQDIALPLGRQLTADTGVVSELAGWMLAQQQTAKGRREGRVMRAVPYTELAWTATDAAWSAGRGLEVRGPALPLLLVLTGRSAELDQLDGPGLPLLRAALAGAEPARR
jgi:uncharacterized protein (TIGR03083 family)